MLRVEYMAAPPTIGLAAAAVATDSVRAHAAASAVRESSITLPPFCAARMRCRRRYGASWAADASSGMLHPDRARLRIWREQAHTAVPSGQRACMEKPQECY